ncbi:MAG: ABC transporter ATP-binding protein [Sphaerochaetaceae bacterium]|nr:ABC transporter ATP-binding protein [Sphaerochaetaceae bacterium]
MGMIETTDLKKRYSSVTALDGVTLSIEEGTVFGFLGPNGAGKTTLIRILTGMIGASGGSYTIGGEKGQAARTHIGYLAQQPTFYGWMTGRELLEISGSLYGMSTSLLERKIPEMLRLCGVEDAADRKIATYSGGMRQRLGIAQAILHDPKVVFLDEPVSALDPIGRKEVLTLIGILRERTTIFMSSHILDDVQRVCDEVAIIHKGTIRIHEKTDNLLRLHAKPVVILEFATREDVALCSEVLQTLGIPCGKVNYELSIPSDVFETKRGEILSLIGSGDLRLERLNRKDATLEEVFMHHIEEVPHVS